MRRTVVIVILLMCATRYVDAGGFDRAIVAATKRVVKLYGIGAGMQEGYGTGVIVSADGMVVTVSSLLVGASNILAVSYDGTRYGADLIHRDADRQLALLQLKSARHGPNGMNDVSVDDAEGAATLPSFPYFDLAVETPLRPGDWVVAAGNAFKVADGAETVSIAHGVYSVSTRLDARRRVRDFPYRGECLVIDAITSNPGAPGSALVTIDGGFVGMTGRVVLSNLTHTHLNYAIPRAVLAQFVQEALRPPSDEPPGVDATVKDAGDVDLGIKLSRTGYRTVLPFVERVRRGSPASRAGVRRDDLILSVNGRTVESAREYDARVEAVTPGESVHLVIRRGRRILDVHVETEAQPE